MSYRSEIKKVIQKYYPKYRVMKVLAPIERRYGVVDTITLTINADAIEKPKKKIK